jgi:hypothetical protein
MQILCILVEYILCDLFCKFFQCYNKGLESLRVLWYLTDLEHQWTLWAG